MSNNAAVPADAGSTIGLSVPPVPLSCPGLLIIPDGRFASLALFLRSVKGFATSGSSVSRDPEQAMFMDAELDSREECEKSRLKPGWHVELSGGLVWSDEDGYAAVHLAPSLRHRWPAEKMKLLERKRSSSLTMMMHRVGFLSLTVSLFVFRVRVEALEAAKNKNGSHFASLACVYWEDIKKRWE